MVAYITAQHPATQRHFRQKIWWGFSAEDQARFDLRWPAMRALEGFTIFVSIAPMIGAVRLPDDFLALGKWVICSGEQGRMISAARWMWNGRARYAINVRQPAFPFS
jgi:protein gp37